MERYWHPIEAWECVAAGLYAERDPAGRHAEVVRAQYAEFLADDTRFAEALTRVRSEWPRSCEQFLSHDGINRIAWLGQAAMCIATGVPARYRGGFYLLSKEQRERANATAASCLRQWLDEQPFLRAMGPRERRRPHRGIRRKVRWHLMYWRERGYAHGIPEMVPQEVRERYFAPSWEAIAIAILSNDVGLLTLGFPAPYSDYYTMLKRDEFARRGDGLE